MVLKDVFRKKLNRRKWYVLTLGIIHRGVNSFLYLNTLNKLNYVQVYVDFIYK